MPARGHWMPPCALIGVVGLGFLVRSVMHQAAIDPDPPGGGIALRSEVTRIVAPRALIEFAATYQSSDDLHAALRARGLGKTWYACTVRCHQANGGVSDVTFFSDPCDAAQSPQRTAEVLATLAGKPPRCEALDYRPARIRVVPAELCALEPVRAVEEMGR